LQIADSKEQTSTFEIGEDVTRRHIAAIAGLVCLCWTAAVAQQAVHELGIKYMRDSEEYATLARQVYRLAGEAAARAASSVSSRRWAVVLDIDETALDNSTYQLERAAYDLPFDAVSWKAWVERRQAGAVPGAVDFIAQVRRAGGHVGWITNRDANLVDATRENLKIAGLWEDDDRLCLQKTPQHTKADRRKEIVSGNGDCAWPAQPMQVIAFVGDQLGDFPAAAEQIPQTGSDSAFGRVCFLLPNSMYGGWVASVTRLP
jgi:5'-nucleotidase (lipoprotein e(P4) family)